MVKPKLPAGTRDFTPEILAQRKRIFNTIEKHYKSFGFQAIETPAMELIETLTGKYGEEGDQLLFRILNSGDFLSGLEEDVKEGKNSNDLRKAICDKGLRYDLTVPLARFVAMHKNEIVFPFKRYQIQNVWRADKPQKGRYREFFQCDADVIGSKSMLYETEFIQLFELVFRDLGIENIALKINNRKILAGIAEKFGFANKFRDLTIALDKIDKIGIEGVKKELESRGIKSGFLEDIEGLLDKDKSLESKLTLAREKLGESEEAIKGIEEIEEMLSLLGDFSFEACKLEFDISLARGLDYYTGVIFEAVPKKVKLGSIASGGRYDNLTETFELPDVSGVGIAFGADRIYDLMEKQQLFKEDRSNGPLAMFATFGKSPDAESFAICTRLRKSGIPCSLHPGGKSLSKQFKYADKINCKFVILAGSEELKQNKISLKNMQSGDQHDIKIDELDDFLKKQL